ncbi:MAG: amidase [Rhodoferax sp.]|uniref:amidase n=1 Tax=Rhodoferax sp. TaxID=50421 RepID=UPI002613519A|nr:amidase [Rhodoferax sp.]MDD5334204.1 amidase [Rhodoferax sp.]
MFPDLHSTLRKLRGGQTLAETEMERAIEIAQSACCQYVFLKPMFDEARSVARIPENRKKPLAGLAVSIKDLFDVAGQTTAAGSMALQDAAVATQDSPAVARLRQAGAAFIGRTNMVEFAFSGVGVNPHFGTPANACATDLPRIPGGSSSGAAVSVATGAAFIGLGSDTGGSIRIPAALNGIVGFKNTARLVPTAGALPLSSTLDTVCALTRSVPDAILAHELLSRRQVTRNSAPLSAYRLGVASTQMLDGLDATVAGAWQRTLDTLRKAGARIDELALSEINELQQIQASGGFSAAESYAWHRHLLAQKAESYDPRVAARIQRGALMSACDYIELINARRNWIEKMEAAMQGFDAILSPTVPLVAPPLAEVAPGLERDARFFQINTLLLRNTSVINMLDGCAISIPCQAVGELPVGLMVWAGAMHDDPVLNIAFQIEQLLEQQ